jgi:hypothetical protein
MATENDLLLVFKYETWIPRNPKHALVYMADEQQHGLGFPDGIDQLVDEVLKELGGSVPTKKDHKDVSLGSKDQPEAARPSETEEVERHWSRQKTPSTWAGFRERQNPRPNPHAKFESSGPEFCHRQSPKFCRFNDYQRKDSRRSADKKECSHKHHPTMKNVPTFFA